MCILFIAKNVHPEYPLIIAANRDEYYARPTQPPHWWDDAPHLFAGKDLQAGGTWLGYNRHNRVAGITNLRRLDWYQAGAKSRGDLVKRFLDIEAASTSLAVAEFTDFLKANYKHYNPFNLLFGDADQLSVFSSADGLVRELNEGIHSLSNGVPETIWPKMQRGIDSLSGCLVENQSLDADAIFSVLTDTTLAQEGTLPETGITEDEERLLSSIFIPEVNLRGMPYGTRSSSVICIDGKTAENRVYMQTRVIITS